MSVKNDDILEFIKLYESEKLVYESWGEFVKENIFKQLGYNSEETNHLIKIPVKVRVKETDSILSKAFYRKEKNYLDPINEITDKVGIRFVVMLKEQIKIIGEVIELSPLWDCSKDVDYEKNKNEHPELFVYQSVHYVVKSKNENLYNGINIKEGTTCEIQIRTLEQHAYAELSHDYIYKKGSEIKPIIKRYLARSMALNEATDDLFSEVYGMMKAESEVYFKFTEYFRTHFSFDNFNEKINSEMYDNLKIFLERYNIEEEQACKVVTPTIRNKIESRQNKILFKQPMIILVYFLAKEHGRELLKEWYLPESELDMVYSDLGISYDMD